MLIRAEPIFHSLLNKTRDDPNILACRLDGSRGKGLETDYSDYDCNSRRLSGGHLHPPPIKGEGFTMFRMEGDLRDTTLV
jgi:hypothetical protein